MDHVNFSIIEDYRGVGLLCNEGAEPVEIWLAKLADKRNLFVTPDGSITFMGIPTEAIARAYIDGLSQDERVQFLNCATVEELMFQIPDAAVIVEDSLDGNHQVNPIIDLGSEQ